MIHRWSTVAVGGDTRTGTDHALDRSDGGGSHCHPHRTLAPDNRGGGPGRPTPPPTALRGRLPEDRLARIGSPSEARAACPSGFAFVTRSASLTLPAAAADSEASRPPCGP